MNNERCVICGEPREVHTKKHADWRNVAGCSGVFREPTPLPPPAPAVEKQVGCERADGLLNVHAENETCDVCAGEPAPSGPSAVLDKLRAFLQREADSLEAGRQRARQNIGVAGLDTFFAQYTAELRRIQAVVTELDRLLAEPSGDEPGRILSAVAGEAAPSGPSALSFEAQVAAFQEANPPDPPRRGERTEPEIDEAERLIRMAEAQEFTPEQHVEMEADYQAWLKQRADARAALDKAAVRHFLDERIAALEAYLVHTRATTRTLENVNQLANDRDRTDAALSVLKAERTALGEE